MEVKKGDDEHVQNPSLKGGKRRKSGAFGIY
jgi:hypothetical protein